MMCRNFKLPVLTWSKVNRDVKFYLHYLTEVASAEYMHHNRKLKITT